MTLEQEHGVLVSALGRAQARCSDLLAAQACTIERLQAEAMRLRAAVIIRETLLAYASEALAALQAPPSVLCLSDEPAEGEEALEASLVAADLVICQTGCISHNAYWRVQEHCRRTGKPCVLVDSPQAMLWLRDGQLRKLPVTAG